MSYFEYDFTQAVEELDRLAVEVPEAIPKAINAMSDVLIPALKIAAPYDDKNVTDEHLRDLIGKTRVRTSKNGNKYQVVYIKKRGKDDKHIYKAVVAEYGRSGDKPIPPRPFWRNTVIKRHDEMIEAARNVIDETVRSITGR